MNKTAHANGSERQGYQSIVRVVQLIDRLLRQPDGCDADETCMDLGISRRTLRRYVGAISEGLAHTPTDLRLVVRRNAQGTNLCLEAPQEPDNPTTGIRNNRSRNQEIRKTPSTRPAEQHANEILS